jgi:hypothetical protein
MVPRLSKWAKTYRNLTSKWLTVEETKEARRAKEDFM